MQEKLKKISELYEEVKDTLNSLSILEKEIPERDNLFEIIQQMRDIAAPLAADRDSGFYLTHLSSTYTAGNKLHAAIVALVKMYDRQLVSGKQLETFRKTFINVVNKLNEEHPRCKPVKASWSESPTREGEYYLSLGGIVLVSFRIYKATQFYGEE